LGDYFFDINKTLLLIKKMSIKKIN